MKILILSILAGLTLTSSTAPNNSYYPLQKGQVRIYKYTETFRTEPDQTFKMEVLNDTKTINGKVYFVVESSLSSKGEYNLITTTHTRINDKGAIFAIGDQDQEEMVFPTEPITVNQTWENTANDKITTTKVINLSGSIETPAKIFKNCLVLEITSDNGIVHSYSQKGVGLVAMSLIIEKEEKLFTYLVK